MSEFGPRSGKWTMLALREAESHQPDRERGGCTCGFCAWTGEHLALMVAGEIEREMLRERMAECPTHEEVD